jgi:hypothetical protein
MDERGHSQQNAYLKEPQRRERLAQHRRIKANENNLKHQSSRASHLWFSAPVLLRVTAF